MGTHKKPHLLQRRREHICEKNNVAYRKGQNGHMGAVRKREICKRACRAEAAALQPSGAYGRREQSIYSRGRKGRGHACAVWPLCDERAKRGEQGQQRAWELARGIQRLFHRPRRGHIARQRRSGRTAGRCNRPLPYRVCKKCEGVRPAARRTAAPPQGRHHRRIRAIRAG